MIVNKEQLKPYIDAGADLIPLNIWNKQTRDKKGNVVIRGKTPLRSNWTKTDKDVDKTLKLAEKGFNVGFRISDTDLIVDIDHRNFKEGGDSLKDLCDFLDVDDLANTYPTVITGSGGFHYYMKKPAGIHIKETVEQFPGIEFKVIGRQVVSAGSKHPNGKHYEWDDFAPVYGNQIDAPSKLLSLLTYEPAKNQAGTGSINADQLHRLLEQLPVEEYATYDEWFKIMCGSHHGTAGLGIEEFLHWSLSNPDYVDFEHLVRYKWASLSEKALSITVNTLYKEVLAHGGDTGVVTAEEDFKDFKDDDGFDNADDFDDIMAEPEIKESYKSGLATRLANELNSTSSEEDIVKTIRAALQAGTIEQVKAFTTIQSNLKWTKSQLTEVVKQIKERIVDDLGRILAEKTMELKFYKKKGLVFNTNGQFWEYNGKYWSTITKQYVGKMATQVLDDMRKKVDIKVKENALVSESVSIVERLSSVNKDILRLRERPHPVVNCNNGELWIRSDGTTKLRKHRPESYLLQVLNVEYSPGAECPLFDKSIRSTFSNFDDGEDIVRHFEEFMGYVLHPDKRPAHWWLFKGPGGDGKSTLMKILSAILGDAVLPESIEKFKGGIGGDNHASANLPGKLLIYDDDLNKNTILPDGTLKQLSEDGELTANPKGYPAFKFRKVCTVTMLSNGFPKTRDLTRGFRRRAMVIPFDKAFHEKGGIEDLPDQIIKKELAGVLNRALQGLQRLRERGKFREPESCRMAKAVLISESNTVALFLNERVTLTKDNKDIVMLTDLYVVYNEWCLQYGINKVDTKQQFRGILQDLDIYYGKLSGNKSGFRGIQLISEEIEDFDDIDEEW